MNTSMSNLNKILFIGDIYSVFIHQLVNQLRESNLFCKIDGLHLGYIEKKNNTHLDNEYHFYIDSNKKKIIFLFLKPLKLIIYRLWLKRIPKYDIINIHYIDNKLVYLWDIIRQKSDKIILSIWGSDYYKRDVKGKEKLRKIFKDCDIITFTNPNTLSKFVDYYNDEEIEKKVRICRFGLEVLDVIDEYRELDDNILKNKLGLPTDKLIITCGYSSFSDQNHIKILDAFEKMKDILPVDKYILVFPLTYGDGDYRNKLITKLKKSVIKTKIYREYLSYNEVAMLRVTSDIMINIRNTDQFSGSMQEALYAGNIVITGTWLPYDLLWHEGIFALKIENPNKLHQTLEYIFNNLNLLKSKSRKNKDIIYNISSWVVCKKDWFNVYMEL